MATQIGVSFRRAGKIYHFDAGGMEFNRGDLVVVDTVRGREMGRISTKPMPVEENEQVLQLKKIVRAASEEDLNLYFENRLRSTEAFNVCEEKIREHKLPMKLIDVEYTLDGNKAIFYFSAEGRIDFRNLVRDLAAIFKKRIELHQIGVRDEAKMIGGLGPCGRSVCCSTFMTDFDPVSIKMAKEQNLSLNPERISGTCGRLMCCLKHEYAFYHEMLKELPDLGAQIELPEGRATVIELCIPKRSVVVELAANNARMEVPADRLPKVDRSRGRDRRPRSDRDEGRDPSRGDDQPGEGDPGETLSAEPLPGSDQPPGDGGRREGGRGDRPRGDRTRDDRPRGDGPRGDRPGGEGDRPGGDRSRGDRPGGDRSRGDRPGGDRSRGDRSRGDRSRSERPRDDRARDDRPEGDRSREDTPAGDPPGPAQPGSPEPTGEPERNEGVKGEL